MSSAGRLLLPFVLFAASPAVAQTAPAAVPDLGQALRDAAPDSGTATCKSNDPNAVLVCGHPVQRFRIDPTVLAAERAVQPSNAKPPLADGAPQYDCVGSQHCGGGIVPLVAMALTAIKAVSLAASGDDWKDAFRTHPDQYQAYVDAESKKPSSHISIGVSAGSK